MGSKSYSLSKIKVTASIDAELIRSIDELRKELNNRSRSQLIEDVIRKWYNEQKKRKIETKVEKYYLALSEEEQGEDQEWHRIAAQSVNRVWEE